MKPRKEGCSSYRTGTWHLLWVLHALMMLWAPTAIAASALAEQSTGSTHDQGNTNEMLSWQVGRVKITRIVEMDLPVPAQYMQGATPEELRKMPWLYPHFVSDDDTTLNLNGAR